MIDPKLFDFPTYLSAELQVPTSDILVEPLSGGGTNLTVRASFRPAVLLQGNFVGSIVLKYAPPFVASKPEFPMSPYRQTIEARALSFLAGSLDHPCTRGFRFEDILGRLKVPRFIRHDETANVLWMSDLGGTKVMPEWLASSETTPDHASRAGNELGRFLAALYSSTRNPSDELISLFKNPYDHPADIMPHNVANLMRLLDEIQDPEPVAVAERFKESFVDAEPLDSCLGISDLWMGSVLVNDEGAVALCDWEMFQRSEGGSELGMLLGDIRGLTLESSTSDSTRLAALSFVNALLFSYTSRTPSTCTPTFIRRLLLGYVRELICKEDDLEGETRINAIKAWVNILRATGSNPGDMRLGLLDEKDRQFLERVLP